MKIEIDTNSGFCFGVENAVEIAEKALNNNDYLFSLGQIVHNDEEVHRLTELGLKSIDREEFNDIRGCNVLIRAHGEPPATYAKAEANGNTIVDATCPIVKKLQSRIKKIWETNRENGAQIVIYGKPGHAEVIGLLGQIKDEGLIITGKDDLDKIEFTKPVFLFAQTTMSLEHYAEIAGYIKEKIVAEGFADIDSRFRVFNTICKQVSNREPYLKKFAASHDIIIFVGGRESSNGKMLFTICKNINPESYFVSSPKEIEERWFDKKSSVGICGATSTPKWLIDKTYHRVLEIDSILNKKTI
jgi:4-hydroxy-3-methylbut-2-enyl diphosphate reductase